MKLIIDCGATKLDAALVDGVGGVVWRRELPGFSAVAVSEADMRLALLPLDADDVNEVYFYGAGVIDAKVADAVCRALPCGSIKEAHSDMLGAARALLGRSEGFAAILGTGSNTCHAANGRIVASVPPMGYMLGDEGSGTRLGMALCREVGRRTLEPELVERFYDETGMTYASMIGRIYRQADCRSFFASLPPFIFRHKDRYEGLQLLLRQEFAAFVGLLDGYGREGSAVGLCGGIADAFAGELRQSLAPRYKIVNIIKRPLDGLIRYHADT